APMIIVGGTPAVSRTPPHCDISWPSPANTTASGGSGGTYTVTGRPPSYSSRSVTSSPAMDIVAVSLSVAQPATLTGVQLAGSSLPIQSPSTTRRPVSLPAARRTG